MTDTNKPDNSEALFDGYGGLNSFRISGKPGVLVMRKIYPIVSITIDKETHILPAKALLLNLNILLENALSDSQDRVSLNFSTRWIEQAIVLALQGIKALRAGSKKVQVQLNEEVCACRSGEFKYAMLLGKESKIDELFFLFTFSAESAEITC